MSYKGFFKKKNTSLTKKGLLASLKVCFLKILKFLKQKYSSSKLKKIIDSYLYLKALTRFSKAFTLIELIVVISVISVIAGISMVRWSNAHHQEELKASTELISSVFLEAKENALNPKGTMADLQGSSTLNGYGVKFNLNNPQEYILFKDKSSGLPNQWDLGDEVTKTYKLTDTNIKNTKIKMFLKTKTDDTFSFDNDSSKDRSLVFTYSESPLKQRVYFDGDNLALKSVSIILENALKNQKQIKVDLKSFGVTILDPPAYAPQDPTLSCSNITTSSLDLNYTSPNGTSKITRDNPLKSTPNWTDKNVEGGNTIPITLNESGLSYSTTFNYTLTDVFSKNVTVQCKTNDPTLTITSFTASSPASVGSPVTFSAQTTSSGFNITDNFTWKFYLKESDYPATPCATATTTYDIPNASQTCTYTSTFVGNAKVEVTRGGVSKTRTVGVGITWPNTTSFAAGVTHSLLGKSDGSLWVTGAGNWGALGTGETSYSSWNQIAPFFLNNNKVKYVDAGSQSSYAVMDDNSLWVTGDHRGGQLGIGMAYQYITSWQSILTGVKTVSASVCGSHALVLKTDGTVWSAGSNVNGSLGVGDTAKRESWTPTGLSNVKDVAAGCSFSVALKNDGTVWVTGDNTYGALGLGDWNHRYSWTQTTLANVAAVSAGQHSMALKNDGTVWATGYNNAGGLGLGDGNHRNSWVQTASNAKYVSVGAYHSFIVKNDGVLWCTGYNDRDQLGMSDTTSRSVWTQNPLSNVQTISANGSHSFALDKDGKLLATGYDSVGQLGFPLSSHVQTWQQSATR